MIRMIGLDLDGTLLTGQKELTAGNRAALEKAAENGVYIVPVTGRPLSGIPTQVMELDFIAVHVKRDGGEDSESCTGRENHP